MNENEELQQLIENEQSKLTEEAGEAVLAALATLGAMTAGQEANEAYGREVAKGVVRLLMVLNAVRRCIEAADPTARNVDRLAMLTRMVCIAFGIDPEPVVDEIITETMAA
jgi:hypothetical protein